MGGFGVDADLSRAPVTAKLGKVDVVQTYSLEAEEQLVQTLRGCSYGRINAAKMARRTPTGHCGDGANQRWSAAEDALLSGRVVVFA